jgi:hypothetical protein
MASSCVVQDDGLRIGRFRFVVGRVAFAFRVVARVRDLAAAFDEDMPL